MPKYTHEQTQSKICSKCKQEKPLDEFSPDRRKKYGRQVWCKACIAERARAYYAANRELVAERKRAYRAANPERAAERARAWREANPERVAEYQRAYNAANREMYAERARVYRARHPERNAARQAVYKAIKRGKMLPARDLTCTECGSPAAEYHHYLGYEREHWLDVVAVCIPCHVKLDKEALC